MPWIPLRNPRLPSNVLGLTKNEVDASSVSLALVSPDIARRVFLLHQRRVLSAAFAVGCIARPNAILPKAD